MPEVDPDKNPMVNLAKRFMPISPQFHGDRFFIWENGKRVATPLFVVLLIVETTDVVFAIDSIPPFLVLPKTRSSSLRPTFLRFWVCARCISRCPV
jgi:tellurite resistance protein TerC